MLCCRRLLLTSRPSWAILVLRLTIAIAFLPHGAQKLLGAFGGKGFAATVDQFTGMGVPAVVAVLIILGESLGAVSLALGFLTRFCAASLGVIMIGAIVMVHGENGFFNKTGGFEYNLVLLGACIALTIAGSGSLGVDRLLAGRHKAEVVGDEG